MKKRAILILASILSLLCSSASFALDVDYINIQIGKDYYNGLPDDQSIYAQPPWFFDIFTGGSGITSVDVTLPNSNRIILEHFGDEWGLEANGFSTLNELLNEYPNGTYTFSFNGGEDSVSLIYYSETEPLGIANITFPDNDADNVPYENSTFTWDSCAGFGENISISVEDGILLDEEVFENSGIPIDKTSQIITGLLPARNYYLSIDVNNGANNTTYTDGADSFWYSHKFYFANYISFKTLPMPGDFQKDGRVNLLDLELLAQAWLATPIDSAWNAACDISEPNDNIINIQDFVIMSQYWQEVNAAIFDSNSATITNPLLGMTNIGDSYSMSGYGALAGAERSYSLIGTETVMGVNCLILKIYGYGEIPRTDYFDIRIAEDFAGNIRILKVTGFEEGSLMSWQSENINFSPIFLPEIGSLDIGEFYPLWDDNYNKVIALDVTVPEMSTEAGPYGGCIQYNWNSTDGEGGVDVDVNYIYPGLGYVKEVWNDGELGEWERNP